MSDLNKILEEKLLGNWEIIVAQGGRLSLAPCGNMYLISGLWVKVNSIWVELTATEYSDDELYDYGLVVTTCDIPPIPEKSKLNHPPRMVVKDFPDCCRLDLLKDHKVTEVKTFILSNNNDALFCAPLLSVICNHRVTFELKASRKYPENIEISMGESNIKMG